MKYWIYGFFMCSVSENETRWMIFKGAAVRPWPASPHKLNSVHTSLLRAQLPNGFNLDVSCAPTVRPSIDHLRLHSHSSTALQFSPSVSPRTTDQALISDCEFSFFLRVCSAPRLNLNGRLCLSSINPCQPLCWSIPIQGHIYSEERLCTCVFDHFNEGPLNLPFGTDAGRMQMLIFSHMLSPSAAHAAACRGFALGVCHSGICSRGHLISTATTSTICLCLPPLSICVLIVFLTPQLKGQDKEGLRGLFCFLCPLSQDWITHIDPGT